MWVWHQQPQKLNNFFLIVVIIINIEGTRCCSTLANIDSECKYHHESLDWCVYLCVCGRLDPEFISRVCVWFFFVWLFSLRFDNLFSLESFKFHVKLMWSQNLYGFNPIRCKSEQKNEEKSSAATIWLISHSNHRWQNKIWNDCEWHARDLCMNRR